MRACLIVVLGVAACAPVFPTDGQLVEAPRVIGIRSVPAERRPRDELRWEALVVGPQGRLEVSPQWALCTVPRRVEERTAVSAACAAGEGLEPTDVDSAMPASACALFGPTPLPAEDGEPDRRPTDPDDSGGYYQPVRARVDAAGTEALAFGRARIRCDLAGATRALFDAFEERYVPNEHPRLVGIEGSADGDGVALELAVEPSSAEPYVVYRPEVSEIVAEVERLSVTWYATSGRLHAARTTVLEGRSSNRWIPDEVDQTAHVWAVVTDSRGGSAWTELEVSR